MNRLAPIATALGVLLCALGLGLTEADSLLTEPHRWESRLSHLAETRPECAQAVLELRKLYQLAETSPREFATRIEPLQNKLSMFRLSPTMRATFGALDGGLDWQEVVDRRQAILIDLRDVHSFEAKKFCLVGLHQHPGVHQGGGDTAGTGHSASSSTRLPTWSAAPG